MKVCAFQIHRNLINDDLLSLCSNGEVDENGQRCHRPQWTICGTQGHCSTCKFSERNLLTESNGNLSFKKTKCLVP